MSNKIKIYDNIDPKRKKDSKKTKEDKDDEKYQCKLSILKILVNSVILETIGSVREAYVNNESIRMEMDSVIIDNIEDVLKKIEEFIPQCEKFFKHIDITKFEETITELEDLDVTLSKKYAEDIWNTLASALLSI